MEPLELVGGVHVLARDVLVQRDFARVVLGIEPAADKVVLPYLLALRAQQIGQPAALASGDEIGAGGLVPLRLGFHDKVLDQPLVRDGCGQRFDSGFAVRHLAGVAG